MRPALLPPAAGCPRTRRVTSHVGQTSRSVRMGRQPTNRYENPAVGQALGLRPPGRAFNNLRRVFDRARVLQDTLFGERSSPETKPRPRPLTPAHKARKATHHPPPPANPTTWALIVRRHNPSPQPLAPARNARPATLAAC